MLVIVTDGELCRSIRLDLPVTRAGWLAAAARLDALGVEVLQALEAGGRAEVDARLLYQIDVVPAEGERPVRVAFSSLPRLLTRIRQQDGEGLPRIVAAHCMARRRQTR